MSRVRNLVIGCDGTWNEPEQLDDGSVSPTNVVKFLEALKINNPNSKQVPFYEEGVGARAFESLPGGIYGYGLDKRILACYRFLQKRFSDSEWERDENRIFLIGFSRGAYTVRRLAGLIAHSGIPVKAKDCKTGWELYKEKDDKSADKLKKDGRFFDVTIEMVGVWDTVKATNDADYHDSKLSTNVTAGYHCMAIDEKRKFFPALRWDRDPRVEEAWFAGVHSDVGGGYKDKGLSDIALKWMIYKALNGHDLQFKARYVKNNVKPKPDATIHDSYTGTWKNFGTKKRKILPDDIIHESVKARQLKCPEYNPSNLPKQNDE